MKKDIFLHEHNNFEDLLKILGEQKEILPQLIEKDYWIMHCLYSLKSLGLSFELKGGTSLSKGYGIIKRFSEDIDIKILPPKDMDVKTGKNQNRETHIESRKNYFNWLIDQIKIEDITVERDYEYDDENFRNIGIKLVYPTLFGDLEKLKTGVLLEVGFDNTTPNKGIDISSWAFDESVNKKIKVIDNRAIDILCYSPEYTLVEKLQAISTKFRQQKEKGTFPNNFMRHYYDVYELLDISSVQTFIGTENYISWKNERFRKDDNKNLSENEAFLLSEPEVYKLYKEAYESSKDLYYQGQIEFEKILERIQKFLPNL